MASPFQQQSLQRKIIYIISGVVLLTGAYFYRKGVVEPLATSLDLREENLGEVELTGSAIRLSLTGSRGLAVCALWVSADAKQKKNQWNELELLVRSITKLQPHFLSPWLFQSWNLAYNVSVESDRVRDKFFFISRGIELLAEGERQNRNQPDLRDTIGFYLQNKIGASDETNTQRSLYQLSLIPPSERNPERFRTTDPKSGKKVLNRPVFEEFCSQHPILVRRLHERLRYKAEDIVKFLEESQKIPCLYEEPQEGESSTAQVGQERLRPPEKRFPVFPPVHKVEEPQRAYYADYKTDEEVGGLKDDFSVFENSLAWFAYGQEALPHPGELPGIDEEIKPEDRTKLRRPKYTTAIFRTHVARAATYVAENLEKEGWFDEKGWTVPSEVMFGKARDDQEEKPLVIGTGRAWGIDAWTESYKMWKHHGEITHLYMTPEEESDLEKATQVYRRAYNLRPPQIPVPLKESDRDNEEMLKSQLAYARQQSYEHYRHQTNYANFLLRSQLEMEPRTVAARKAFSEADQLRKSGQRMQAKSKYESKEAMPAWKEILMDPKNANFASDMEVMEGAFEVQYKYLELVKDLDGPQLKELLTLESMLGEACLAGFSHPWAALGPLTRTKLIPSPEIAGPFDDKNGRGEPLITEETKMAVLSRHGLLNKENMPKQIPKMHPGRPGFGPPSNLQSPGSGAQ
jgi:hypothetical protein